MEVKYLLNMLVIEIELNESESKILRNLIYNNFGNTVPSENDMELFKKHFISFFGKVKFELFKRWYDSRGMAIAPPERKWMVSNYRYEVQFLKNVKKLMSKKNKYKVYYSINYLNYKSQVEKAIFPLFMYDPKPSREMVSILSLLCRKRVKAAKIENQMNYVATIPSNIKKKRKNDIYKFYLRKLADYERLHIKMKQRIKLTLDKSRRKDFEKIFGWRFD